jgi:hypothetical protein
MRNVHWLMFSAAVLFAAGGAAQLQAAGLGSGRIICWKDKSGKVVGCGDIVPPEYQDSATKELDRRGVTIKQSEAALTPEQKKAQQAELERKQAEDLKKEMQRRQDKMLLDTYSQEKEIDQDRARHVQGIESDIESLQINLRSANTRQANARARAEQYKKNKKPVPPEVQDEADRMESEKIKTENQIAQKRKDIAALNQKYDEFKKRYFELTGKSPSDSSQPGSGARPAPQPAPATSAASVKKQ